MSEALTLLGFALAIGGPLMAVALAWSLSRWVIGPHMGRTRPGYPQYQPLLVSCALVAVVLLLSWIPGKMEYGRLCASESVPSVARTVRADGFFRDRMFSFEAEAYLRSAGFSWIESVDPYHPGRFVRYTLGNPGEVVEVATIPSPGAEYSVSLDVERLPWGAHATRKRVFSRVSGEEIARAAEIVYSGGPLSLFFGSWATESCPSVRDPVGREAFGLFYELEARVLGGQP